MKGLWIAPLFALSLTGCLNLPTKETKPPVPAKLAVTEIATRQPVNVEQINDANAKEMSVALTAELDEAQNGLVIAPEKAPAKPK